MITSIYIFAICSCSQRRILARLDSLSNSAKILFSHCFVNRKRRHQFQCAFKVPTKSPIGGIPATAEIAVYDNRNIYGPAHLQSMSSAHPRVSRARRRFHRKQLSVDDASEYNWETSITAPSHKNKISIWDARKVGLGAISSNFIFQIDSHNNFELQSNRFIVKTQNSLETLPHLSTFASRTIWFNVIRDEITFFM